MVRTVKVRLELDRDDYKRGLRDAAGEMRGFDGEVRTLGKDVHATGIEVKASGTQVEAMGREVDTAAKKTTGLGDETEKTKRKTTGLGEETDKAKEKTKGFGEETGKTKAKMVDLAKEIEQTKTTIRELAKEFEKTGDVDLFKKIGDQQSYLAKLTQVSKILSSEMEKAGTEGGRSLSSSLAESFRSASAQSGGIMVAAIAYALTVGAPVIGAAISSAVLLGVGGGALAGGVALAFGDARVQAATHNLGTTVSDVLRRSAVDGLAMPLTRAVSKLGDDFERISPAIDRIFGRLGPTVEALSRGLGGMAVNMMPGLERAANAAIPLLDRLARELPKLGHAMSVFFDSMAEAGPGAEKFFTGMLHWLEGLFIVVGRVTEALSKMFDTMTRPEVIAAFSPLLGMLIEKTGVFGETGKKAFTDLKEGADGAGPSLDNIVGTMDRVEGSFRDAIREAEFFIGTLDKVNGGNIALATSQIGAESALARFKEAIKDSNGSLDIHTEKGRAAKQAAIDLALAAGEVAQKTYEQSGSSSQGAVALEGYRRALVDTMVQSGMTKEAAHALAEQWLHVPPEVSTQVKAPGLAQTKADAAEAYRGLDALDGKVANTYVTNHVITRYSTEGERHAQQRGFIDVFAAGGIRHAAVGMVMPPTDPGIVIASEPQTGGEVLTPLRGISRGRAMDLSQVVGDSYGFDVVPRGAPGYAAFANSRPMGHGGTGVTHAGKTTLDPQALARAVASALNGMTVVMDGQAVGRIQGRQANLLTRGG